MPVHHDSDAEEHRSRPVSDCRRPILESIERSHQLHTRILRRELLMSTRFWFLFVLCAATAMANVITYDVTVNTSSISGTTGSLDFNFNPGSLVTQSASLQILSFTSNGTLAGSPELTGDASGALPGTLTFDNG